MNAKPWLIAGAALLAGACTAKVGNQSGNVVSVVVPGGRAVAATLSFAAQGCAATWNGQAVTVEALARKSSDTVTQAIHAAGGIDRLTIDSLPAVRIEGAPTLDWSCAGPYVAALTDGGTPIVLLAVAGDTGEAPLLGLPIPNMPPPVAAIAIDGGGYRWNGEAIDAAGLDRHLSQYGAPAEAHEQGPPSVAEQPPPGEIRLEPAAGATFATLLAVTRAAARYNLTPDLAARPGALPAPGTGLPPPPIH